MTFTRFIAWLGAKLTIAQFVLYRVLFDGEEIGALKEAHRAFARQLFGPITEIPSIAREVAVLVKGARVGGTRFGVLRLLHLALTQPLATLAPGEIASALIVAPDLRLAKQALRYALGAAKGNADIARRIVAKTKESFTLKRDDGSTVVIECLPATQGGSALRGRSLVGALLTECAFFRDADYAINDVEILRAVAPRIMPGGQIIIESTPFAEIGLLYDTWKENFEHPRTALVAHCPTTLMRPDPRTLAIVERERERDSENAQREFDATFMSAGTGLFFDGPAIDRCVVQDRAMQIAAPKGASVAAGGDLGLRSDGSAIAILARGPDDVHDLCALEEQRPEKGKPLVFSNVIDGWTTLANQYACGSVTTDLVYFEAVREKLEKKALDLVACPSGQDAKTLMYLDLRAIINDGRLRLPPDRRLIAQLKAIVSKPTAGGKLSISSPRKGNSHGDAVSALVCAVWALRVEASRDVGIISFASDRSYPERGSGRLRGGRYHFSN